MSVDLSHYLNYSKIIKLFSLSHTDNVINMSRLTLLIGLCSLLASLWKFVKIVLSNLLHVSNTRFNSKDVVIPARIEHSALPVSTTSREAEKISATSFEPAAQIKYITVIIVNSKQIRLFNFFDNLKNKNYRIKDGTKTQNRQIAQKFISNITASNSSLSAIK